MVLSLRPLTFTFGNCRSLRNKGPEMQDLVLSSNSDVVGLTETHIKAVDTPSFIKELTPDGFNFFHTPRSGKLGGGVGFLIRNSVNCAVIQSPTFSSFEHIIISANFGNTSLNHCTIYRPQLSF